MSLGLMQPALQSLMTRRVSPSEQGQLQGANNSIFGLTGVVGPVIFGFILAQFLRVTVTLDILGTTAVIPLVGAPFFLSALLMLSAAALSKRVTREPVAATAPSTVPKPNGPRGWTSRPAMDPSDMRKDR